MKEVTAFTHKDRSPTDTIKIIRDILSDVGIHPFEYNWNNFGNKCYSVSLSNMSVPSHVPQVSAHGKGISMEFALAAAYGEYIERLQNNPATLHREYYGIMPERLSRPDEKIMTLGRVAEVHKGSMKYLVKPDIIDRFKNEKLICVPYYNVTDNEVTYLPENLIFWTCTSNGMCAGNTPQEALVQGICEIFERYVLMQILTDKTLKLPVLPHSELRKFEIFSVVEEMENKGYEIVIRDCTLGGKLPVLGVLVFDKNNGRYRINLGSDPIFEVAFQRCLTEWLQGVNPAFMKHRTQPLNLEGFGLEKSYLPKNFDPFEFINKTGGPYLESLFEFTTGIGEFRSAFESGFVSHSDSVQFLTKIVHKLGHKLYVRDVSFLGFPAFRVYIPGMSEIDTRGSEAWLSVYPKIKSLSRVVISLKESSAEDTLKCAEGIEELIEEYPYLIKTEKKLFFQLFTGVDVNPTSDLLQLFEPNFFLAMLFHRAGNFSKAFQYLEKQLQSDAQQNVETENSDYYQCALLYFKFKSSQMREEQIRQSLIGLFGKSRALEVIKDLADPEKAFDYYLLPRCGNCTACPIKHECCYDIWKAQISRLKEKMAQNPIDQAAISSLFN